MPTYTYHCDACDQTFDVYQRMTDDPLTACECGEKGQIKRLLSAGAGVIFKGSGFYQTDYKQSTGSSNSSESKTSESKSSDSSSKPAEGCGASKCCMND